MAAGLSGVGPPDRLSDARRHGSMEHLMLRQPSADGLGGRWRQPWGTGKPAGRRIGGPFVPPPLTRWATHWDYPSNHL